MGGDVNLKQCLLVTRVDILRLLQNNSAAADRMWSCEALQSSSKRTPRGVPLDPDAVLAHGNRPQHRPHDHDDAGYHDAQEESATRSTRDYSNIPGNRNHGF